MMRWHVFLLLVIYQIQSNMRSPVCLCAAIAVLVVAGFFINLYSAIENHFSYPYTEMGSAYVCSVATEDENYGQLEELLSESSKTKACVYDYEVLVEAGGRLETTLAHGVSSISDAVLDDTQYNMHTLGLSGTSKTSVVMDSALANRLGVHAGDTCVLRQLDAAPEFRVKVSDIVTTYASTQGIIVENSVISDMVPTSLNCYFDDLDEDLIESLGLVLGSDVLSKGDVCSEASRRSHELFPTLSQNVLQWFSCLICFAAAYLITQIRARQVKLTLHMPLRCIGYPDSSFAISFMFSALLTFLVLVVPALIVDMLIFSSAYNLAMSVVELLGTLLLEVASISIAIICVVVITMSKSGARGMVVANGAGQ